MKATRPEVPERIGWNCKGFHRVHAVVDVESTPGLFVNRVAPPCDAKVILYGESIAGLNPDGVVLKGIGVVANRILAIRAWLYPETASWF
jgi:hypothetical protein